MPAMKLTLGTLNRGAIEDEFQKAMRQIAASMEDGELKGKKRVIDIKIEITPEDEYVVRTEASVKLKMPVVTTLGTGWVNGHHAIDDEIFETQQFGIDPRQVEFPGVEKVADMRKHIESKKK